MSVFLYIQLHMKINDLSLPHPVVGHGDDADASFIVDCSCSMDAESVTLQIKQHLQSVTLQGMIESNDAEFCIEVQCPQTFYRRTFRTQKKLHEINVRASDIRGMLQVTFYITASRQILSYELAEANKVYHGYKFQIEKADVLGYGGGARFQVDKSWEKANSVAPLIIVKSSDKLKSGFGLNFQSQKIVISMPPSDYEKYRRTKKCAPIFHAAIIVPTLMRAWQEVVNEKSQYSSCAWWKILKLKIENDEDGLGGLNNLDAALEAAQIILKNPVGRTLSFLDNNLNLI